MKRKQFRTSMTYSPAAGKKLDVKPSITIGGEAYTVPEMIERYSQGRTIPVNRSLQWAEEEVDFENDVIVQDDDLTEIDRMSQKLEALTQQIDKVKQKYQKEQKTAQNEGKAVSESNKSINEDSQAEDKKILNP